MSSPATATSDALSPWWGRGVILTMVVGFSILILVSVAAYRNAPPIPGQTVSQTGTPLFTADDISSGQEVFLKYGLMDNGSIWGHGAYLGPDFSASYLHDLALALADQIALGKYHEHYANLPAEDKGAIDGAVAARLKANTYDAGKDVLTLPIADDAFFKAEQQLWRSYFHDPAGNGGLKVDLIADPTELHQLNAFFAWAAWVSVAERPQAGHSYTNNFPYDRLAGNQPTAGAVIWSVLSIVFLLGGIGVVLVLAGRFDDLGWHGNYRTGAGTLIQGAITPGQRGIIKFVVVAAVLFLGQTLVGGAVAHYRSEPGDFYGLDLSLIFPSNLMRTWHLQTAIFWIATCFVAGALFVATLIGRHEPAFYRRGMNILFTMLAVVVFGSLLGEWAGISQWFHDSWFWIGNQGWEYLELGRLWQILLAAALGLWLWLLYLAVAPALRDPKRRLLAIFFLLASAAIPLFYVPALFFGARTNFTVVDLWRFWIAHLWLEGFFEFFVTVMVAIILHELGLVSRKSALRTIYLDAILYFAGGVIGTGHHWYFSGQTEMNMALSAIFSALEVVPLTLITLDAWPFISMTRLPNSPAARHKWTFLFLMSVGFWNFVGAGVFGFLINLPIVSYFEVGTILTPNHAHAALMGVFGMLGVALISFMLRETVSDAAWSRIGRYMGCAFWGLNIGLGCMVVFSLFPGGILQVVDVVENGYWHARSLAYTAGTLARTLEWMRLPGDLIFIVFGSVPVVIGALLAYRHLWSERLRPSMPVPAPSPARGN